MTKKQKSNEKVSQRALARALGINHSAIAKGIADGRLAASVTYAGGKPQIRDLATAVAEWNASRRPRADDGNGGEASSAYQAARTRREAALAQIAEFELARLRGEYADIETIRDQVTTAFVNCRTHLLGIPWRICQRVPEIGTAGAKVIDDVVREVLEELADRRVADVVDRGIRAAKRETR